MSDLHRTIVYTPATATIPVYSVRVKNDSRGRVGS